MKIANGRRRDKAPILPVSRWRGRIGHVHRESNGSALAPPPATGSVIALPVKARRAGIYAAQLQSVWLSAGNIAGPRLCVT